MRARPGWLLPAGLAAVVVTVLAWQHQRMKALERDAAVVASDARALAALRTENAELKRIAVPAERLSLLRSDHLALARLRTELSALKQAINAPRAATKAVPSPAAAEPGIPTSEWHNAGNATPVAVLETSLWALTTGDVDVLTRSLAFDSAARPFIDGFFGALPPGWREKYVTPERLVAEFTARDRKVSAAHLVAVEDKGPEAAALLVRLRDAAGETQPVRLSVQHTPEGWKLLVPATAVQAYANEIALQLQAGR